MSGRADRSGRVVDRVVVLRRSTYGDADLIVTFLARDHGKITAFARGARSSKRRFGASLAWFSLTDAQLSRRPGKDLFSLAQTDLIRANTELALDPATLGHASYATELVRELIAVEHPEPQVFDLLVEVYATLRAHGASRHLLRTFELSVLSELGMAPSFEHCSGCGDATLERGVVLDAHGGGIACQQCAAGRLGRGVRPISFEARRELALAGSHQSLADAAEVGASRTGGGDVFEFEREAQKAMAAILSRHLSSELRSLEFIAKMNTPLLVSS